MNLFLDPLSVKDHHCSEVHLGNVFYGLTLIPEEGPSGKGPGAGPGRSSEPAGDAGQTGGKGRVKGRLQGVGTGNGAHSKKSVPQYPMRGFRGTRGRNQRQPARVAFLAAFT